MEASRASRREPLLRRPQLDRPFHAQQDFLRFEGETYLSHSSSPQLKLTIKTTFSPHLTASTGPNRLRQISPSKSVTMPRPPTCAPFSTSQTPVRARRARQFQCLHRPLHTTTSVPPARSFSTTSARPVVPQQGTPRWMYTPPHMTAPVSLKKNSPDNVWRVNESQARLDDFYARLLGEGGPALLTDEVKWLAVTHKSFDQGRRGYNDRLAFLGTFVRRWRRCNVGSMATG